MGKVAEDFAPDDPLTLKEACEVFFRDKIKPASLRAEARRGTLEIARIGRTDFVTPAAIKGMMLTKCRVKPKAPASTSEPTKASGSSGMDRSASALVAANQIAEELKKLSPGTSRRSSGQPPASVIPIGSRSPRS